ncbi:hypothetical protein ACELLULO517_27235 [Acidisoma cellulosilytica]|uniref:Uncharacterized protein n=1 Tax=Acidisoma cellulosilyticum TaxID=2802395 RepID=A0A964E6V3_9PROT|nr:TMEM43 family protein [Acidisoma cellulosilyticum]MCB8883966.1 hypothetical protein [Acidisoma cellulosilyticum]
MIDKLDVAAEPIDQLIVWPIIIPLAAILLLGITGSLGSVLFFPVSLITIPIILAWLFFVLATGISCLWRRSWKRGMSLVGAFVIFWPMAYGCSRASDYFALAVAYPYYATKIYCSGCNTQTSFDWGAVGLLSHYERSLVYDPSGELAKKIGDDDERAENMEIITTTHLIGHWYVQTQTW